MKEFDSNQDLCGGKIPSNIGREFQIPETNTQTEINVNYFVSA